MIHRQKVQEGYSVKKIPLVTNEMTDENILLFKKMEVHLLNDKNPSRFFNGIDESIFFSEHPFTLLNNLKKVKQSPVYHPEGSVWNHTMLVVDQAAKHKEESSNPRTFMWAALLHDVGKAFTTNVSKGKITSYDHEKVGVKYAKEFLELFSFEEDFIIETCALIRWHMQILFVVNSMKFADIQTMKNEVNVEDIALLGLCDRLGRGGSDLEKEEKNIERFLEICNKICNAD